MTGKTHRIIGITSGLSYLLTASQPHYAPATLGFVLAGSYFGSLLPDLDQPAADIWDSLPFGHTLGQAVDPFFKHRNISHSALGLALTGFIFYWLLSLFPSYWGVDVHTVLLASLIAYGSHLLADSITVEGIPLLYPYHRMFGLPPKPFEGIRIMTGQWFENLILFPAVDLWLVLTVAINWGKISKIIFK